MDNREPTQEIQPKKGDPMTILDATCGEVDQAIANASKPVVAALAFGDDYDFDGDDPTTWRYTGQPLTPNDLEALRTAVAHGAIADALSLLDLGLTVAEDEVIRTAWQLAPEP
jgi:hypothetical protein